MRTSSESIGLPVQLSSVTAAPFGESSSGASTSGLLTETGGATPEICVGRTMLSRMAVENPVGSPSEVAVADFQ